MKTSGSVIAFFESMSDEVLLKLAIHDPETLHRLCIALTLDVQLYNESL
jgi:hypothetical protein